MTCCCFPRIGGLTVNDAVSPSSSAVGVHVKVLFVESKVIPDGAVPAAMVTVSPLGALATAV